MAPASTSVPASESDTSLRLRKLGVQHRREFLLLVAVLFLATTLRIGWPTLTEFKFDEARLSALALELTQEGRLPLAGLPSSAGFSHSPINVYLFAPAFLFGSSPLPPTIYSGLLGVLAVALCWWLARRWAGSGTWGPWVTALLLATSPWLVVFNRKVWQIALVPVLTLVFVGFVISALVEGRRWHLAWALVAYALLVQVHPSAISLALALVLWFVVFRRQVCAGPLALGIVLGMATTIPFLIYQVQEGWPLLAALQAMPEAVTDLEAVRLAAKAITGSDIHALAGKAYPLLEIVPQLAPTFHLALLLTLGALAMLAWRAFRNWKAAHARQRRAARVDLVLITWLLIPVLFNVRHSLELHLHSFALIVPAAYLIAGRGIDALASGGLQYPSFRRVMRIAGLATVSWLVASQIVALVLMARFVANHDTPGGFGRPLGQYLTAANRAVEAVKEGEATEVLVVGEGDLPATDATPAIFDILLRGRAPYRFVEGSSTAVFPPHPAVALISPDSGDGAGLYDSWPAEALPGGYRLVYLDASWPSDDLLPFHGPRTFENGVELQGYRWQGSAIPAGEVSVWLLWQVLWLNPDDSHFSLHLLDDGNQSLGQQDTEGYPSAYRRKGDRILSKFTVNIAEQAQPGPYRARVGLYLYPEVVSLSVLDGAGNPAGEAVFTDLVIEGILE